MLAAGAGGEAAVCARPPIHFSFAPSPERGAAHGARLKRYRALYGADKMTRPRN